LGVSKTYLGLWKQIIHSLIFARQSGDSNPRSGLSVEVPAVHPPPASTGIGQRPKAAHITVHRRHDTITTTGKTDLTSQVRRRRQLVLSHATKVGKEGLLQQHRSRLTGRQHTTAGGKKVRRLLAKYHSIIRSETPTPFPTHGIDHHIDTGSHRPMFAQLRGLAPDKLKIAEAEFKKLEKAGIIRRSNSVWASPLHMVP
jgi:hypothetical protein